MTQSSSVQVLVEAGAKELTEEGLKVLMLVRSKNIEHVKDYKNMYKETWNYPHRGRPTQAMKKNVLTGIAVIISEDGPYCGVVRVIA